MTIKINTIKGIIEKRVRGDLLDKIEAECIKLEQGGALKDKKCKHYMLEEGGLTVDGEFYKKENLEADSLAWLLKALDAIDTRQDLLRLRKEQIRQMAKEIIKEEAFSLMDGKCSGGKLQESIINGFSAGEKLVVTQGMIDENFIYADFTQKYQHGNSLLHRIFSWGKEEQSASAISRLEELFNKGEVSTDNLHSTFEAKNDEGLTPLEAALFKNPTKVGNVFKSTNNLEVLRTLLNSKGKDGVICYVAGKYLDGENQASFYEEAKQGIEYRQGLIGWARNTEIFQIEQDLSRKCVDELVTAATLKIKEELSNKPDKTRQAYIKAKIASLYKIVQGNTTLQTKLFNVIDLYFSGPINDVYPDYIIKDKVDLIELNFIRNLPDHNLNKSSIELAISSITKFRSKISVPSSLSESFVEAVKTKLDKDVVNKALQPIGSVGEERFKSIYSDAVKNIQVYKYICGVENTTKLDLYLKNVVRKGIIDFLNTICKAKKGYSSPTEATACLDKTKAFKQEYSFLGSDLFSGYTDSAERYLKTNKQYSGDDVDKSTKTLICEHTLSGALGLAGGGLVLASGGGWISSVVLISLWLGADSSIDNNYLTPTDGVVGGGVVGAVFAGASFYGKGGVAIARVATAGLLGGVGLAGVGGWIESEIIKTICDY